MHDARLYLALTLERLPARDHFIYKCSVLRARFRELAASSGVEEPAKIGLLEFP